MTGQLARALDFTRRSIESTKLPFYQALLDYINGGAPSKSGMTVSQESATRLAAFWRGIRILSETLASVPLCLYERQKPRGRRKATELPLFGLLHDEPNPQMTSFFMRECMQAQLVTHGNGYGVIRRDAGGRIREIWPLVSARVEPRRLDGVLVYILTLDDGTQEPWAAADILHIPGLSFDGLKGKSVLQAAREVIGLGLAVQDYGATFFRTGGRPPGVVETQMTTISKENKINLQESWLSGRGDNWHQVAFLPRGMKYTPVGIPPDDAQFLETRKFTIPEIARMLGVPPHLLYDLEKATFSNIEQQSLEFIIYTMRQYFVRWEQELNRKLLLPAERANYYFEFNADGLLRGDATARGQFYSLGRQWGWFSANDIRELENQPDLGAAGDIYLTPINMANADELVSGAPAPAQPQLYARQIVQLLEQRRVLAAAESRFLPPAPARARAAGLRLRRRIRKTQTPVIEERARIIVNREIGAIEKELKTFGQAAGRARRDAPALRRSIEEFYAEHAGWAGQKMHPIARTYAELITGAMAEDLGLDPDADIPPELEKFVADYSKRFGIREASEGRLQLLALTQTGSDEEVAAAVRGRLAEWSEKRAGKIAAIEATRQMSAVAKTLYVGAGVSTLVWVASAGACAFCQGMDGRTAGVQQNFVAAGQDVHGDEETAPLRPADNIGHPPLHDNCDCDIVSD